MPHGKRSCPICAGTGVVKEDADQYEFVTRDPITSKCMICNGTGEVGTNKKLPNGKHVNSLRPTLREKLGMEEKRQDDASTMSKRLNVSKKAMVPDTGLGYQPVNKTTEDSEKSREKQRGEESMFLGMVGTPRLNKVLASGKAFLIVTETEPYYLEVYRMIRCQERKQGTWTAQDELLYVEALEEGYDSLVMDSRMNNKKEAING